MAAAPAPAVPAAAAAVTPAFPVVAEATYNTSVTNAKERGYSERTRMPCRAAVSFD